MLSILKILFIISCWSGDQQEQGKLISGLDPNETPGQEKTCSIKITIFKSSYPLSLHPALLILNQKKTKNEKIDSFLRPDFIHGNDFIIRFLRGR